MLRSQRDDDVMQRPQPSCESGFSRCLDWDDQDDEEKSYNYEDKSDDQKVAVSYLSSDHGLENEDIEVLQFIDEEDSDNCNKEDEVVVTPHESLAEREESFSCGLIGKPINPG